MSASADNEQPTSDASSRRGWFAELRRRKVFRVQAAYGVAAWLVLQIVDVLSGVLLVVVAYLTVGERIRQTANAQVTVAVLPNTRSRLRWTTIPTFTPFLP